MAGLKIPQFCSLLGAFASFAIADLHPAFPSGGCCIACCLKPALVGGFDPTTAGHNSNAAFHQSQNGIGMGEQTVAMQ